MRKYQIQNIKSIGFQIQRNFFKRKNPSQPDNLRVISYDLSITKQFYNALNIPIEQLENQEIRLNLEGGKIPFCQLKTQSFIEEFDLQAKSGKPHQNGVEIMIPYTEFEQFYQKLKKNNVEILSEPQTIFPGNQGEFFKLSFLDPSFNIITVIANHLQQQRYC